MRVIITETSWAGKAKNTRRLEVVLDKELGLTIQENKKNGTINFDLTPGKAKPSGKLAAQLLKGYTSSKKKRNL